MAEVWQPILRSAGAGALNRVVSLATRFLVVPLLLRYLGRERYGLWMTISAVTAYIFLLDFGLISALVNRLTRACSRGNGMLARLYVWSATLLLGAVGVLGTAVSALLVRALDLPVLFGLSSARAREEVAVTVFIALAATFGQLVFAAIQRWPYAMHRGELSERYILGGNLLSIVVLLVAIRMDFGLPGIALALTGAPVVSMAFLAVHLALTGILGRHGQPTGRVVRIVGLIGRTAPHFAVMQLCGTMMVALQFVLLGYLQGAAAVAPYGLLTQALLALQIPFAVLQQPLWTRAAQLYQEGRVPEIRRMTSQYFRVALIYALFALAALVLLINPVLATLDRSGLAAPLGMRVGFGLVCSLGILLGANVGSLLLAMDLERPLSRIAVVQLAVMGGVAVPLTMRFGATGMISSVLVANLVAVVPYWLLLRSRLDRVAAGSTSTAS